MKNEEPQLFKYKVVYTPRYIRKGHVNPSACLDDITEFFEETLQHLKGKHCRYHKFSPFLIIARFSKHGYVGLVVDFIGVHVKDNGKERDVGFSLVYFDDSDKDANPYALSVCDHFTLREDPERAFEMMKACVGHYFYGRTKLEDNMYFLDDQAKPNPSAPSFSVLQSLLVGSRNVAITKHDLLNGYLHTLEPGIAYTRNKQRDLCHMIYKRFGIGIKDDEKIIAKPFYYLNKAMKYTDFKMVPVGGHNTYDTAATYYGMRVLMPKEDDEKVDYFEEITGKIYDATGKKK